MTGARELQQVKAGSALGHDKVIGHLRDPERSEGRRTESRRAEDQFFLLEIGHDQLVRRFGLPDDVQVMTGNPTVGYRPLERQDPLDAKVRTRGGHGHARAGSEDEPLTVACDPLRRAIEDLALRCETRLDVGVRVHG